MNLLERCGYANAATYTFTVLARRLEAIEKAVPDVIKLTVTEARAARLMRTVMSAVRQGDRVVIVGEEVAREVEEPDHDQETAEGGGPVDGAVEDLEPDVRGHHRDQGKGYQRKTAGGTPDEFPDHLPTERAPNRHGTVKRAVFDALNGRDAREALTKDELFRLIRKQFPQNSKEALRHVVDAFPHWLPKHYPFWVRQTDKAYWLEPRLAVQPKPKRGES